MNGQSIFNANGDQFIVTELIESTAYPSACGKCGGITTWEDIEHGEHDENVVIFALSLYNDKERAKDAPTSIVTCKGCALGVIDSYFHRSSTGIQALRKLLAPIGNI